MSDIRFAVRPTLAGAVWPEQSSATPRALRALLLAMIGSAILALSARISVPFSPVPLTLQSLAVLLLAAALGARLATATVVLYLAEGAAGLPIFAGTPEHGLGVPYMMGPTGGFLLGYVVCAAIVGWCAERGADRAFLRLLPAMVVGEVVIFALGWGWLSQFMGAEAALRAGVLPFLAGDLVKTALAALLVPAVWGMLATRR